MSPLFVSRGSLPAMNARISASAACETPQPASEIVSIWFGSSARKRVSALVAEPDSGEMDDSKGYRSGQRGQDSCRMVPLKGQVGQDNFENASRARDDVAEQLDDVAHETRFRFRNRVEHGNGNRFAGQGSLLCQRQLVTCEPERIDLLLHEILKSAQKWLVDSEEIADKFKWEVDPSPRTGLRTVSSGTMRSQF
jgi:hypothetical protein